MRRLPAEEQRKNSIIRTPLPLIKIMRKNFNSAFQPSKDEQHRFPPCPAPSTFLQKISHALPLPFHLLITVVSVVFSVVFGVVSHAIDGPIKRSWGLMTTVVHAAMKAILQSQSPQGR